MASVTQRIKQINQPDGGYIKPKDFQKIQLQDKEQLFPGENIHASLVGMVVDYLTRFVMGTEAKEAFKISLLGAMRINNEILAHKLLSRIKGLDDESISCACKLVGYDVCYRAGIKNYKPVEGIEPDADTIHNIRIMVQRSFLFFRKYGPVTKDGVTFEGGYTDTIHCGDGDFLTEDTLWDFKVSNGRLTSAQTLQLLIYYIMGCHSIHTEFLFLKKLGIYNPRMNTVYLIDIESIDKAIIKEVSENVIGYGKRPTNIKAKNKEPLQWTLDDLVERYGVSKQKISDTFISCGLPYYTSGIAYRFDPAQVEEWERQEQWIPFGRRGKILLPAYVEYGIFLKESLYKARKEKNRKQCRQIKKELWQKRYYIGRIKAIAIAGGVVIGSLLVLLVYHLLYLL